MITNNQYVTLSFLLEYHDDVKHVERIHTDRQTEIERESEKRNVFDWSLSFLFLSLGSTHARAKEKRNQISLNKLLHTRYSYSMLLLESQI